MKHLKCCAKQAGLLAILILLLNFSGTAQIAVAAHIPSTPIIKIGYYTTTTLIFPAGIVDADIGFRDIIAEKQAAVSNVLKLKADKKDFTPTNLTVCTSDGRLYAFSIRYDNEPDSTTITIRPRWENETATGISTQYSKPNQSEIMALIDRAHGQKPENIQGKRVQKMKLVLKNIHVAQDMIILTMYLQNNSRLPFVSDFARLYVKDKKHAKRMSYQQVEIEPIYQDRPFLVPGKQRTNLSFAIPTMTLNRNKMFYIELYEKNGNRHMTLKINHRKLFRTRKL